VEGDAMTRTQPVQAEVAALDHVAVEHVLRPLARKAGGLNGADIEELIRKVRRKARREKRAVTYDDIESLLLEAKRSRSGALLHRIAVHEAGHVVCRLHLRLGRIIEITIDGPEGGHTLGTVSQDEQTEELLTAILVATLAGRAAEEEIFGAATMNSGGSERSDLAVVTKLALDMETIYGFGRKWPLLYRKAENGTAILGTDLELAERVNVRLEAAYRTARDIVAKQKPAIEYLADVLLGQETLKGPELDAVVEQVRQKMVDPPE
jgi:cell division protease FtsH